MTTGVTIPPYMTADKKNNITRIINDYSRRLLGFIRKRVTNEEDAKDILQDVFYQLIGNTSPIEQVSGWLFTVARNKITDRQRKKTFELAEDLVTGGTDEDAAFDWTALLPDTGDDPETVYLRNFFWETLQEGLDELPPEQRDIFVLTELEGIPFKEIAAQTGENVNTLISRKRYAVLHLRERLALIKNELLTN